METHLVEKDKRIESIPLYEKDAKEAKLEKLVNLWLENKITYEELIKQSVSQRQDFIDYLIDKLCQYFGKK